MAIVTTVKEGDPVQIADPSIPRKEREQTGRGLTARGSVQHIAHRGDFVVLTVGGNPPVVVILQLDGTAEYGDSQHQLYLEDNGELIPVIFDLQPGTPS